MVNKLHDAIHEASVSVSASTSASGRCHVLIVDDIPDNIRVLAGILGTSYDIIFATNGKTAIEMATKYQPDLILLDIMMPDMDGFAVIAQLQEGAKTHEIPVIFVTAHQDSAIETAALEAGAVDFIPKPINPNIARARVHIHAKLVQQNKELKQLSAHYKKMADEFREQSIHDRLTGLYNRYHLKPVLNKEIARAQREAQALSLAMLDIDHFKEVNDLYGHAQGDAVLSDIGQLIQHRIRKSDTAFRHGGEEFMLVLPNTSATEALILCEDIRKLIASSAIGGMKKEAVKISIGIAQFEPTDDCVEDSIRRADQALYSAKNAGRNRVEIG